MAWTAPMTAVAQATFSDVEYNTYIRDNLLANAPAKATTVSSFFVATGTNAIAQRQMTSSTVATSATTASGTYTSTLSTGAAGPSVTATVTQGAVVFWSANMSNSGANGASRVSVAMSGANSAQASNAWAIMHDGRGTTTEPSRTSTFHHFKVLRAGSTTFTMKYACSNTGTYSDRTITVIPL